MEAVQLEQHGVTVRIQPETPKSDLLRKSFVKRVAVVWEGWTATLEYDPDYYYLAMNDYLTAASRCAIVEGDPGFVFPDGLSAAETIRSQFERYLEGDHHAYTLMKAVLKAIGDLDKPHDELLGTIPVDDKKK